MRSVNRVTLLGSVGNDPETRTTSNGSPVSNLSLATNEKRRGKDGQDHERTDWHRLTFFGKLAELVAEYVSKGDRLYVEGRLQYTKRETDGGRRTYTDVIVDELVMLGGSGSRTSRKPSRAGF